MKKVYLQTFGCQMNEADSQEMMLTLAAKGCTQTDILEEADIVLVNTCTIREHAEHKALSYLGRLAKWKAKKDDRKIIFAGCAAQRLGQKIKKKFPHTDIINGAKNIDNFASVIESQNLFDFEDKTNPTLENKSPIALVNIMRGCSCKCSYCIVPYVRGEAYSLDPKNILAQVQSALEKGASEIVLLGQTVNAYSYKGFSFSKLLREICAFDKLARLRYLSPHPMFINEEFLNTLKDCPKIARHIHLPIQSGSTRILADMKRNYTREELLAKLKALREIGIEVSTDIIVGYPKETEKDFEDTLTLCQKAQFSAAYCFKFSPRKGTPAALLKELDQEILEKRLDILLNEIKKSSKAAYARQAGTTQQVLFEKPTNGRTSNNFWVRTKKKYPVGAVVDLQIKESKDTILLA
ncbi:MAG: tRNA (N6-isopentenyl adenosine(37)-C2)-methylthiotransferase MiaB [Elusimicrobiaceae bacterium]|nr:tRNA (N6-isopentenyl adenosine(37)-C2)-methylthiotransferase MiaB [Elusimicrobiaceae bacterium]